MSATFLKKDLAILGGGPAGYVAAIRAVQLGATVALIEERDIGGTCLNRGCIPGKALLRTAEIASIVNKSMDFGLDIEVSKVNWATSLGRKEGIVSSLKMGLEHLLVKNKVHLLKGAGRVKSAAQVTVSGCEGDFVIECQKVIITTGSEPILPDIPGIHLENVINTAAAMMLHEVPRRITVMGGGPSGLEFASLFSAIGSQVTLVETQDYILPWLEPEVTAELLAAMKRQGVSFRLSAGVREIKEGAAGLIVSLEENGREFLHDTDMVLVAVGRKAKGDVPDLTALGVENRDGAIVVDDRMQTGVKGIYAAGDVVGGQLLAHLAFAQGRVAAQNALGLDSKLNYLTVPFCIYTDPEIASVGLSERECINRGIRVKAGRFDFRHNGRALCMGEPKGFVKIIVDEKSHAIMGAQILGPQASEIIAEVTLAVALGVSAETIADLIHPHPALSEAIMEACADAIGRAVHK